MRIFPHKLSYSYTENPWLFTESGIHIYTKIMPLIIEERMYIYSFFSVHGPWILFMTKHITWSNSDSLSLATYFQSRLWKWLPAKTSSPDRWSWGRGFSDFLAEDQSQWLYPNSTQKYSSDLSMNFGFMPWNLQSWLKKSPNNTKRTLVNT